MAGIHECVKVTVLGFEGQKVIFGAKINAFEVFSNSIY